MKATVASRRINNALVLVRFGYTVDCDGSVAKEITIRNLVEAILDGEADFPGNLWPLSIPHDVREVIISEYQKYDHLCELAEYWRIKAEKKSFPWNGKLFRYSLPNPE